MYSPKRYPPAGARDQRSLPCSCWDFPRIRGEKLQLVSMPMRAVGSPPHTRGKEKELQHIRFLKGITPAYAGKRRRLSAAPRFSRDHPRIRGEKNRQARFRRAPLGSPPHTRGKAHQVGLLLRAGGITPAYAGKSRIVGHFDGTRWDHPRIRGEKFAFNPRTTCRSGSPPHTRGKAVSEGDGHVALGITPAYAGKSQCQWLLGSAWRDHPRIRGEKRKVVQSPPIGMGSPPHTRGKENGELVEVEE